MFAVNATAATKPGYSVFTSKHRRLRQSNMKTYTFVTGNVNKVAEARRILDIEIDHCALDLDEIQEIEVEAIVTHKVRAAYLQLNRPVLIEDTGLYIAAWNGLPGALIKWFMERIGDSGICDLLRNVADRRATAKTIFAIYDGQQEPQVFPVIVDGHIAEAPVGDQGFGWDSIFIPLGGSLTFAQMTPEEKDRFSTRRHALQEIFFGSTSTETKA